jgi:hypothetical protein
VLEQTQDEQEVISRVVALDIGKAELVCCVRVPEPKGGSRRMEEVTTYSTMTRSLQVMADRLLDLGVTRVVMEATSSYWRPPFYLLEAHGFQTWLVNAKDVKHLPGRPKTDRLDVVWLCKVAERQMLRPSFVPPVPMRRLRHLTRYRMSLVSDQSAEKNRVEKLLEDAQLRLSVVASDIFRGLRAGDDGRADLRGTQPQGAGADGPEPDARQDPPAGGGVRRALHRPPRLPAGQDACPHRRPQRGHRRAGHQDRGPARPFRADGGPPWIRSPGSAPSRPR